MTAARGALSTLARLFEDAQTASAVAAAEKRAKAHEILSSFAHDDSLRQALTVSLQATLAVGRSAYARDTTFPVIVRGLFWALKAPMDIKDRERLQSLIFLHLIEIVHTFNATDVASSVVSTLQEEVLSLRIPDLPVAISIILRGIVRSEKIQRSQQSYGLAIFSTVDVLPQFLLRATSSPTLTVENSQSQSITDDFSGPEYRDHVITKMMSLNWPRHFFLQVVKSFREFSLSESQERIFCAKIYREARRELSSRHDSLHSADSLSTMLCSLVQLVGRTKNEMCARLLTNLLLTQCARYSRKFDEEERSESFLTRSSAELTEREVWVLQSTVLYHLDLEMKQRERLGKIVITEIDQRASSMSSFELAILLMISAHKKYDVQVLGYLERHIVGTYTTRPTDSFAPALARKSLLRVVSYAKDGEWGSVTKQLVQLAFQVLEHQQNRSANRDSSASCGNLSTAPPWVDFGVRLLLACFQHHISVRDRILDRTINMIIVQNPECRVYVYLLGRIVRRHIADLTGSLEVRIRDCLEHITRMTPWNVNLLLTSLSPLLKLQPSLKSFVILTLRKAMLRKDDVSRIIAVRGFALLLCLSSRMFSRTRTLTQLYSQNVTALSQGIAGASVLFGENTLCGDGGSQEYEHSMAAEDLYRQFSGIFKRALQLQPRVRVTLLGELLKVFNECPALRPSILDLVFQHFLKYYEANESLQPPLKFDFSIGCRNGSNKEPLALLLHSLVTCFTVMQVDESDRNELTMIDELSTQSKEGHTLGSVEQTMQVLFERFKHVELSDLDFGTSSPFDAQSELGKANRRLALSFIQVLDVCINWNVMSYSVERSDIWSTITRYAQLQAWMQQKLQEGDAYSCADGSLEVKKKRKLSKTVGRVTKHEGKLPRASNPAEEDVGDFDFDDSAYFRWAMPLSPAATLKILKKIGDRLEDTSATSISQDEEKLLMRCLDNSTKALILIRRRHEGSQEPLHSRSGQSQELQYFTKHLGLCMLRVFQAYSGGGQSVSATRGRNDVSYRSHQRVVKTCIEHFVRCIELWNHASQEVVDDNIRQILQVISCNWSDGDGESEDTDNYQVRRQFLAALQLMVTDLAAMQLDESAVLVFDALQRIASTLPQNSRQAHYQWMCEQVNTSSSSRLLESIVGCMLGSPFDDHLVVETGESIAQALQDFCNGEHAMRNGNDTGGGGFDFSGMDEKNVLIIAAEVLSRIDEAMGALDAEVKCFNGERRRSGIKLKEDDIKMVQQLEDELGVPAFVLCVGDRRRATSKDLCHRLLNISTVLRPFVAMNLNKPIVSTRVLKLIGRLYKSLVMIVNDKIRQKEPAMPKYFRQLLNSTAGEFSPAILQFIACIHDDCKRAAMSAPIRELKDSRKLSASQSKLIPDVIYQLEQFDVALIKLSKLCKGCDFSPWCRLRQSRDFRLNKDRIKQTIADVRANEDDVEATATAEDTVTDINSTNPAVAESENDDTESAGDEEDVPGGQTRHRRQQE